MATQAIYYEPPQNELSYYEELFTTADAAKTGEINGRDAVSFLSRSKLPVDNLKNIWNMADQNPKTNTLDKRKFFTSVRLIQIFQNGQKPQGANLMIADPNCVMRPPFFEGMTGNPNPAPNPNQQGVPAQPAISSSSPPVSPTSTSRRNSNLSTNSQGQIPVVLPVPAQQMQPQPSSRSLTQDPYHMLPGEQVRYESLFPQYEKDGFVYGKEAVDLFTKSGLGKEILRDIWNLVDNPVDNRLSKLEFATAMHLIVCISKKNLPLPPTLPPTLLALKGNAANDPSSSAPVHAPQVPEQQRQQQQGQFVIPSPPRNNQPMPQPQQVGGPPPSLPGMQQQLSNSGIPGLQQSLSGGSSRGYMQGANMHISDAFDGMQIQGDVQVASRNPNLSLTIDQSNRDLSNELSSLPTPPLNNTTGSSSQEELEKVRSVLQKLQAENISLKAQLGQCSDEEKQVRDEITRTVDEIGTLSQELTSVRSQVVNAKASLIEASAELKAQMEKRDMMKTLISETSATKEAFDTGLKTIHDATEESAKETDRNGSSYHAHANQTGVSAAAPVANPFGDAGSVLTDAFADSSSYHNGGNQLQRAQPPAQGTTSYYEQQPMPVAAQPQQTGPSEELMRQLDELRRDAERSQQDATSADDHAKALAIQFEDIRAEAERANTVANEKQNAKPKKKKGLRRGGGNKKEQKRELEQSLNYAAQKNNEANRAHYDLTSAEANASKMMEEANKKRAIADGFEMQLAEQLTNVQHEVPATLSREDFAAAAVGGQNFGATPQQNPYPVSHGNYQDSNGIGDGLMGPSTNDSAAIGYGGYPTGPGLMGNADGLMGGSVGSLNGYGENVMGGSVGSLTGYGENLMGGSSAAYPADGSVVGAMSHAGSVSYAGTHSIASERGGTNTSVMNSAFPTDSSIADMSNAGLSYMSAKHSSVETSNAGARNPAIPVEASIEEVSNTGISYASADPTHSISQEPESAPVQPSFDGSTFEHSVGYGSLATETRSTDDGQSLDAGILNSVPSADAALPVISQGQEQGDFFGSTDGVVENVNANNTESVEVGEESAIQADLFVGIPSPDKEQITVAPGSVPATGMLGMASTSNDLTDGIPSPMVSNDEYTNPFASS